MLHKGTRFYSTTELHDMKGVIPEPLLGARNLFIPSVKDLFDSATGYIDKTIWSTEITPDMPDFVKESTLEDIEKAQMSSVSKEPLGPNLEDKEELPAQIKSLLQEVIKVKEQSQGENQIDTINNPPKEEPIKPVNPYANLVFNQALKIDKAIFYLDNNKYCPKHDIEYQQQFMEIKTRDLGYKGFRFKSCPKCKRLIITSDVCNGFSQRAEELGIDFEIIEGESE